MPLRRVFVQQRHAIIGIQGVHSIRSIVVSARVQALGVLLAMACVVSLTSGSEPSPSPQEAQFFERNVRPVLIEKCASCHSAAAEKAKKLKGSLLLDTRAGILAGGATGPAIVPGKPSESLLIKAVRGTDPDLKMPPKTALSAKAIADLEQWVQSGAAWPDETAVAIPLSQPVARHAAEVPPPEASDHWAFRPVKLARAPRVQNLNWTRTDIDHFILAQLEKSGLRPAAPADRRVLIRRATFDLTGLPPTVAEVQAFIEDPSTDAFAKVVDRLLASSAYGERWGRYWLDLARYADTNGADENYAYPNAWRYRDYVVRSFNADKPYDRFVSEQVAGDLMPAADDMERAEQLTATGFLVLGPKMLAEQDKPKLVMDLVDEQIDVVGQTFLGLTVGCARCHDHKFDPISTVDYYALAGVFKSTKTMADLAFVSNWLERPLPMTDPKIRARWDKWEADLASAKAAHAVIKAAALPAGKQELDAAKARVVALEKARPDIPSTMAVQESTPVDVPVHIRGSHLTLAGQPTPRGFIHALDPCLKPPSIDPSHSGRLELAHWLTDPANPLTARVMVNRIWQGHFGVGLVATPSNFGRRGAAPTHPELLDWLAIEFVQHGWSVKQFQRLIMLSAVYQCDSAFDAANAAVDPENALLWRQNIRRLEAEPIRDALLAVTGDLDRTVGGSLSPEDGKKDKYSRLAETDAAFSSNRRAIYLPLVRSHLHDLFTVFDYTDAGTHTPRRPVTTVPQQALFMLNNDLVVKQAAVLARKLAEQGERDEARIERAYLLLYARSPKSDETAQALSHLSTIEQSAGTTSSSSSSGLSRERAWASLCRVLLAANEFVYVR